MHHGASSLLWVGTGVISIGIFIFFLDLQLTQARPQFLAWYSAAAFVFLTFPISLTSIWGHLISWRDPLVQPYVLRILALPPLYSLQSWLSLRFHDGALYFGAVRDCYEAYAIYCFFNFLLAVLGGPDRLARTFRALHCAGAGWGGRRAADHPVPLRWCVQPWPLVRPGSAGSPFLSYCQIGVVQYVALKVATTLASFVLEFAGVFGEGEFRWDRGFIYVAAINNLSQMWAMYCLVQFYSVFQTDLRGIRPIGKLVAVKSVVFFTYTQSCLIMALHWKGLLPSTIEAGYHWSTEDVAKGLQDWLICVEMLIAAICFREVFSHKDYKEAGLHDLLPKTRSLENRGLSVVVGDKGNTGSSSAGERLLQKHGDHHHHHHHLHLGGGGPGGFGGMGGGASTGSRPVRG